MPMVGVESPGRNCDLPAPTVRPYILPSWVAAPSSSGGILRGLAKRPASEAKSRGPARKVAAPAAAPLRRNTRREMAILRSQLSMPFLVRHTRTPRAYVVDPRQGPLGQGLVSAHLRQPG